MPKVHQMFPSKYVKGEELDGKTFTLTIKLIRQEKMRFNPQSPEAIGWVIYVKETERGIVMGKPLATQLTQILGSDDTDDWIGKQVVFYSEPVMVGGQSRMGIRARKPQA